MKYLRTADDLYRPRQHFQEDENKSSVPTEGEDIQTKPEEEPAVSMGVTKKMRSTRTLSMALLKSQSLEIIDADAVAED